MSSHFMMSTFALIIFQTLLSAADTQARSSEKCSQKYFYKVTVAGNYYFSPICCTTYVRAFTRIFFFLSFTSFFAVLAGEYVESKI